MAPKVYIETTSGTLYGVTESLPLSEHDVLCDVMGQVREGGFVKLGNGGYLSSKNVECIWTASDYERMNKHA